LIDSARAGGIELLAAALRCALVGEIGVRYHAGTKGQAGSYD
jgi:hypothetical protein